MKMTKAEKAMSTARKKTYSDHNGKYYEVVEKRVGDYWVQETIIRDETDSDEECNDDCADGNCFLCEGSPSLDIEPVRNIKVKNPEYNPTIYMFRIPLSALLDFKDAKLINGNFIDNNGSEIKHSGGWVYYELNEEDGFYHNTINSEDVKSIDQLLILL